MNFSFFHGLFINRSNSYRELSCKHKWSKLIIASKRCFSSRTTKVSENFGFDRGSSSPDSFACRWEFWPKNPQVQADSAQRAHSPPTKHTYIRLENGNEHFFRQFEVPYKSGTWHKYAPPRNCDRAHEPTMEPGPSQPSTRPQNPIAIIARRTHN